MVRKPSAMRGQARVSRPVSWAHQPPSLGWMLLLAAALFALSLPIVGPLDDHHFVERAHNHGHVYLNGRTVGHDHAYAAGSAHRHPLPAEGSAGSGAERSLDGTVFLAPVTSGLMLASSSVSYHPAPQALTTPPPRARNDNPLVRFVVDARQPASARVSPPHRPPIA